LCGVAFCPNAVLAESKVSPADSNASERRMNISLKCGFPACQPSPLY
jgi:hypothetical protein